MSRGVSVSKNRELATSHRSLDTWPIPKSNVIHLDAANESTVMTENGVVNKWKDISTAGNDNTFTGEASSYDDNAIENNPAILIDFDEMWTNFSNTQPFTTQLVIKSIDPDTSDNFENRYCGSEGGEPFLINNTPSEGNRYCLSNRDFGSNYDAFKHLPEQAILTSIHDSSQSVIRRNGTQIESGTDSSAFTSMVNFGTSVSGSGNETKGTYYGEFLLYNSRLPIKQIKEQERRLSEKWGISVDV